MQPKDNASGNRKGIVTMFYEKVVRPLIAKKPIAAEALTSQMRQVSSGAFMSDLDSMLSRSHVAQQKRNDNA